MTLTPELLLACKTRVDLDVLLNASGCLDCSYCSDCSSCSDCSDCSDCSGCSDCSYCTDCSGCSYCYRCTKLRSSRYVVGGVQLTEEQYRTVIERK